MNSGIFEKFHQVPSDFLTVKHHLMHIFGRMVSKGCRNAGQGRKKGMGMVADVPLHLHLAENDVQMIENVFFDESQLLKKSGVDRPPEKKVHHHSEILIVMREILDVIRNDLF